jgi:NAD(P)-dependent dehydrogenase (short-subunit alcohol dehydrogenase family)
MELTNKVAAVTGASSGLGAAVSRALVGRGAHVYGLARSEDKLDALHDELGERFHPLPCDVTDLEQVQATFDRLLEAAGRLDVLVNNAGLGRFGPVESLPEGEWALQMRTNLDGVFYCTQAAVPAMKEQNAGTGFGGHIVNIASVAGLIGNPNLSAYNTTKFGLRGFSEALMKELRNDGIKVTCVYPGSIETSFADDAGVSGSPNPMTAEDVAGTIVHLLEGPDNYLISEVVMRPLRPRG